VTPRIGFLEYTFKFSQTHICQIWWIETTIFLGNKDNGYKFTSFKRNYFHKHEKCLCKDGAKIFGSLICTYKKVQVLLLGMKPGGIGPLKLLHCTNLFHIVENPMSQLAWSLSTLLDIFIQHRPITQIMLWYTYIFGLCNYMIVISMKMKKETWKYLKT
jgi:hypothetical protein